MRDANQNRLSMTQTVKQWRNWRTLAWLLAVVLFVLVLLAGQKLLRLVSHNPQDFDYIAQADEHCQLRQQTCYLAVPNEGRVGLAVTPQDLPLLTPLEWQVSLEKIKAKQVVLDIVGLNMEMGYNRTTLTQQVSHADNAPLSQLFRGQALLPICTLETMEWEARLLIETQDQQRFLLPFRFQTEQRLSQ